MTRQGQWQAVGQVVAGREDPAETDHWGGVIAVIEIVPALTDHALEGLAAFSHVQVVFAFHLAPERQDYGELRRPRGRLDLPAVGVFADRGPHRPNHLGVTECPILAVAGRLLMVRGLDAVQGTPILDLKPVVRTFVTTESVEPEWVAGMLAAYWD